MPPPFLGSYGATSPSPLPASPSFPAFCFVPPSLALGSAPPALTWLSFLPAFALGGGRATSFHPKPLNSWVKDIQTALLLFNLPTRHNCWGQITLGWKGLPLTIYYLCLSSHPKLSGLFHLAPVKHLWPPTHSGNRRPSLRPPPNVIATFFFSPKHGRKAPLAFLAAAFSSWDYKSQLYPLPSIWLLVFFIDKLRTNWGAGLASDPPLVCVCVCIPVKAIRECWMWVQGNETQISWKSRKCSELLLYHICFIHSLVDGPIGNSYLFF